MSPSLHASWNNFTICMSVFEDGLLQDTGVAFDNRGVRKILIKPLKLIKVYFKEIKNKINPWFT